MPSQWQLYPRIRVSGKPKLEDTLRNEITAIVCVAKKGTDPDVVAAVQEYAYLPIADSHRQLDEEGMERAVATVLDYYNAGHSVLVHCLAGRNRSVLVASVAIQRLTGLSGLDVIALARDRRPKAIANPVFEKYLEEH